MHRFGKPLFLCCCVALGSGYLISIVSGQVSDKKQKGRATTSPALLPDDVVAAPMESPEPGSPEAAHMADFRARIAAGLVPTVHIGPTQQMIRSVKPKPAPNFVPTQIVAQKGIAGEMLAFQQKLSRAFAAGDPMPASRVNHFGWLKAHPNVRIYGWYGTVTGAEVQADSSVIAVIEFHPQTDISGMRGFVPDFVTEKYRVSKGAFDLIDTDGGINVPERQIVQSL